MTQLWVEVSEKQQDLPKLYWIPKMHKTPCKSRFIAGSKTCSTKPVSSLLTRCFQCIKSKDDKYCSTIFNNSGINRKWILKNTPSLLSTIKSNNIKGQTVSALGISLLYAPLFYMLNLKVESAYLSGSHLVMVIITILMCLAIEHSFLSNLTKNLVMLHGLKQNLYKPSHFLQIIYVKFGDNIYGQTLGIPMGTDCVPLLADLYTYEYDFIDSLILLIHLAKKFNFTFRYIDDFISINNKHFSGIYPPELELKQTTESTTTVSYLDRLGDIDGFLTFKLFDKRDYFNFTIVNFLHLDSNIPVKPAYGVYVSQSIRYFRACTYYSDFLYTHQLLVQKLVSQGYRKKILRLYGGK